MAKTLAYIQEHGYGTVEDTEKKFSEVKELASSSRKELKAVEGRLRQVRIYARFRRAGNKENFRQAHKQKRKDIS